MSSRSHTAIALVAALLLVLLPGLARAEPPDAGAILRESDTTLPTPTPRSAMPSSDPQHADAAGDDVRVHIAAVRVVGSTRYDDAEWRALLSDLAGRDLSFADLRRAADRVTRRYRADGWFARAYLPEQSLHDGVLTIAVIEASLGGVRIESPASRSRVDERLVRGMLTQRQNDHAALAVDDLERATLLLEELPGIRTTVVLAPGAKIGETDILARIDNTRRLRGRLSADNGGIESTGRERVNGELLLESPLHRGDRLAGLFDFADGTSYGRLSYDLPLGTDGWRLRAATSRLDYELGGRFVALEASGHARTWSLTAAYPWVRTSRFNLRVSAGYEERRYENFVLDGPTSAPHVRALQGALSLDRLDALGGGGLNRLDVRLTSGELDLSANATDVALDGVTARRDGGYTKIDWNLARLQRLGERDRLLLELSGQVASRNLSSSEQMSLGGMDGVRAFPVLEGSGDEGWIGTVEWTHTLPRQWRIATFFDYGRIRVHRDPWEPLTNRYALQGIGTSLGWSSPRGIELHATVASRTAGNPASDPLTHRDSDGSRREPQFWLTSRWQF
jgi:hemolysin activation/secretion protein